MKLVCTRIDFVLFVFRSLSFNNLTRLDEGSLADLGGLQILHLSHNSISHIAEGAFKGLKSLRILYVFWIFPFQHGQRRPLRKAFVPSLRHETKYMNMADVCSKVRVATDCPAAFYAAKMGSCSGFSQTLQTVFCHWA